MNRLKFLYITTLSTFGILFSRWVYLFLNLNKDHRIKNLYVFDEKNNIQNDDFYSFNINNIKFKFNKNSIKNVKKFLPSLDDNIDFKRFHKFDEFLNYTYTDLKNNENICSGFYLSRSEIHVINVLK